MKKGDAALIVMMVAAGCFLSHVTAEDDIIAGFARQPFTRTSCFGEENKGDKVVGLSVSTWEDIGAECGKKLRVICMGPESPGEPEACNLRSSTYVDVIVVDRCKKCEEGTIKLSREAFNEIAFEDAHRIKVQYVWAP